jgi:hypothetical protein
VPRLLVPGSKPELRPHLADLETAAVAGAAGPDAISVPLSAVNGGHSRTPTKARNSRSGRFTQVGWWQASFTRALFLLEVAQKHALCRSLAKPNGEISWDRSIRRA